MKRKDWIKQLFITTIILLLVVFYVSPVSAQKQFTVVLDAGHGGKDPGAVGQKIKEKDINLEIILKLGELIKKNHPDVKVVYTRSKDVFVELVRRSKIATENKADLFISVHTNAAKSKTAKGTETYVLGLSRTDENLEIVKRENSVMLLEDDYTTRYEGFDPKSAESYIMFSFGHEKFLEQSINLAASVQEQFKNNNRDDRGVRQGEFWVLRSTNMPSILVEVGYISNREEENFLAQSSSRQKLAESIYNAFSDYKADWTRKQHGNFVTSESQKEGPKKADSKKETPKKAKEENLTQNNSGEDYRIQIMATDKKYDATSPIFKGLSQIRSYEENKLYKYTYGSFKTRKEALEELPAIQKLFKGAFVVRFIDNKKQ